MATTTRRYTNVEMKGRGGIEQCEFCNSHARFATSGNGVTVWHCEDHKSSAQSKVRTQVNQQHLDYLSMIEKEGKNIDDPTYLMQAFSITERHAKIIIQHWQNTATEYQDAMFDGGVGYGR